MSWDAYLIDPTVEPHCDCFRDCAGGDACEYPAYPSISGDWNYTHNCNGMIEAVIDQMVLLPAGVDSTRKPFWTAMGNKNMGRGSWWDLLDGLDGPAGAEFLSVIIKGLEAEPERFRAMNPGNGWGDYDTLLETLREMRDAVPSNTPSRWRVGG